MDVIEQMRRGIEEPRLVLHRHPVPQSQGPFDGNPRVAEIGVVEDFRPFAPGETAIEPDDISDLIRLACAILALARRSLADVAALVTLAAPHGDPDFPSINQLD